MFKTRDLVIIALISAISYTLSMIVVFRMPQGGSITLYLVPLLIAAFNDNFKNCLMIGIVTSVLQVVIGGYILNPVQVMFDYFIPVTIICISGYLIKRKDRTLTTNLIGFGLACVISLLSYVCSGILFYETPFLPSLIYNATFFIPTIIINIIVFLIINQPLSKVYPK